MIHAQLLRVSGSVAPCRLTSGMGGGVLLPRPAARPAAPAATCTAAPAGSQSIADTLHACVPRKHPYLGVYEACVSRCMQGLSLPHGSSNAQGMSTCGCHPQHTCVCAKQRETHRRLGSICAAALGAWRPMDGLGLR